MNKFRNKYRIPSSRASWWNYGSHAAYFVTICTKNRKHFFGEIIKREMHLSEIGKIVEQEWQISSEIRPDMNLELGEFKVMPNHFHAIIIIGKNKYNHNDDGGGGRDAMHCVSTIVNTNTNDNINQNTKNKFGPQSKNLASIMRGFKSAVTKDVRLINPAFGWQSRYHDHIIRNEAEYQRIVRYIINNPSNWKEDIFFD